MAAKKKAAKKKAAVKKKAAPKRKYGDDMVIESVGENPRRKGTASFDRYADMAKYVAKNKGCTVADVIKNTTAKRGLFNKEVGTTIKIKKVKPAAPAAATE